MLMIYSYKILNRFWGFLKSPPLTYPCYKISEEREKLKG